MTIAFVLLAGGGEQRLASAEAKGDTGAGDAAVLGQTEAPTAEAPAPEPVLGAEPSASVPEPVEPPPVAELPAE
ncbi:MAG: hypothetical protein ACRDLY_00225, partial [Thermoleophilaceae bacterium]